MSKVSKPKKFFDLNIFWFKCFGLWVPNSKQKSYKPLIYVYNVILVSYSITLFTIAQMVTLFDKNNNRETFIKNLNLVSTFCVSNYKVFIWFLRRKTFLKIMEFLEDGYEIFEEYDDFKPIDIIAKRRNFKDTFIKSFSSLSYFISFFCLLNEFTQTLFSGDKYFVYSNQTNTFRYDVELPFQSWIPFDPFESKIKHFFAVFMEVIGVVLGGSITIGVDTLYMTLVLGVTTHFELLQGSFRTVRENCANKLGINGDFIRDPPELIEMTDREMKKLVTHLQKVLTICDLLEDLYTFTILLQLLVSMVALCTCLFLVSDVPINSELAPQIFYLLCVENQIATYCYAANEFTLSASMIPQSLYESNWLSTSNNFKNSVRLTMLRMSKPVCLTIGKFMPLTLSTFVSIGRASYSLLAVLKR